MQELYLHPELKDTADRTLALGSPLMDVVRFFDQVKAIAGLSHITKLNGILETDNAFTRGKNSYEAEINAAEKALSQGMVEGNFTRTWELPNGEIIGKPFDGKDPLKFILLMNEAGFSPLNFPKEPEAVEAICSLASLDDSFITLSTTEEYLEKMQVNAPDKMTEIMTNTRSNIEQIKNWLTQAKQALYQIPTPERTYNRWLVEFQKVRDPSPLFQALLESVSKHFILS